MGDSGKSTTNKNTDFNNITSLLFQHQMIVSHRISLHLVEGISLVVDMLHDTRRAGGCQDQEDGAYHYEVENGWSNPPTRFLVPPGVQ